jgi:hypothetical protein
MHSWVLLYLLTTIPSPVQASKLVYNGDVNNVSESLETYLVCLFGYVMFNNVHISSKPVSSPT